METQITPMLLGVDPGKDTGFAVFRNHVLLSCGLVRIVDRREGTKYLFQLVDSVKPTHGIVEVPRVYPQRKWKGDPNDLVMVAVIAGMACAAVAPYAEPEIVYPHTWKGNRPKAVDNELTLEKLNPVEVGVFERYKFPKTFQHNVLDAIGLGLWRLGRR